MSSIPKALPVTFLFRKIQTYYIINRMDHRNEPPMDIGILVVLGALLITMIVLTVIGVVRKEEEAAEPEPMTVIDDPYINMSLEEKEERIYQNLLKAGFSPAGACGIMGNIAVESPDFDPSAVNEKNGAYGLFQWTDDGDRQKALKNYCIEHDIPEDSIDAQLSFAIYEIEGGDPIACRLNELLRDTDDTYTAAAEFTVGFERCITDNAKRADTYTGSLYPEFYGEHYQGLSKRINKAMNYYNRFNKQDSSSAP